MQKKHILKALSLLAAVCITAGCSGSDAAETTTTTATQITSVVSNTLQTTIVEKETDSEISASSQLEIDYVDDDGIIYYKNPTEWTYEKFYSALTINGNRIDAPLTLEKLGQGFSVDEATIDYDEEQQLCVAQILYDDNLFAQVRFKDVYDTDELEDKEIDIIFQLFSSHTDEECFDVLRLNNIGMGSNKDDIKSAIGVPYEEADYILVYNNNDFSFQFDGNGNADLLLINFEVMKEKH